MLHNNKFAWFFQYTQGAPIAKIGHYEYSSPISKQGWLKSIWEEDFTNKEIWFDGVVTFRYAKVPHLMTAVDCVHKDYSLVNELPLNGQQLPKRAREVNLGTSQCNIGLPAGQITQKEAFMSELFMCIGTHVSTITAYYEYTRSATTVYTASMSVTPPAIIPLQPKSAAASPPAEYDVPRNHWLYGNVVLFVFSSP